MRGCGVGKRVEDSTGVTLRVGGLPASGRAGAPCASLWSCRIEDELMLGLRIASGGAVDRDLQRAIGGHDGEGGDTIDLSPAFLCRLTKAPGCGSLLPVEARGLPSPVAVLRLAFAERLDGELIARRADIEGVEAIDSDVRRILPS